MGESPILPRSDLAEALKEQVRDLTNNLVIIRDAFAAFGSAGITREAPGLGDLELAMTVREVLAEMRRERTEAQVEREALRLNLGEIRDACQAPHLDLTDPALSDLVRVIIATFERQVARVVTERDAAETVLKHLTNELEILRPQAQLWRSFVSTEEGRQWILRTRSSTSASSSESSQPSQ